MRIVENFLRCNKFLLHADIGLTIRSEPLTRDNELTILVDGFMDTITIYYFFPKVCGSRGDDVAKCGYLHIWPVYEPMGVLSQESYNLDSSYRRDFSHWLKMVCSFREDSAVKM